MENPSTNPEEIRILYSEYGYVKVSKDNYENKNILPFSNFSNNMTGQIHKSNLSPIIKVKIKTLYSPRKVYIFELKPEEKLLTIISKIKEEEEKKETQPENTKDKFDKSKTYRLISSLGQIKEVNLYHTLYEENIKNNQILILAECQPARFSDIYHGNQITFESSSILYKNYGDDIQIALIEKGCNIGKLYTEFSLDTEPDERNILIGASLKRDDFDMNEIKNFWGYILSEGKKISQDGQKNYGKICKVGDRVGILINFEEKSQNKNQGVSISFFVNGINQGEAFQNLEKNTYYPSVIVNFEGTRIKLIEHSVEPDKNKKSEDKANTKNKRNRDNKIVIEEVNFHSNSIMSGDSSYKEMNKSEKSEKNDDDKDIMKSYESDNNEECNENSS